MRDKLMPWTAAIYCAVVVVIDTIGNICFGSSWGTLVFNVHMPMCFFFVGDYLYKLKKENGELRHRLDAMNDSTRLANK